MSVNRGVGDRAGVRALSFFNECCFRVRVRVTADTNPNLNPKIAFLKKIAPTPRLADTPSNWYRHNCTQCWKFLLIQQYGSFDSIHSLYSKFYFLLNRSERKALLTWKKRPSRKPHFALQLSQIKQTQEHE